MKIGFITLHKVRNYGSVLQTYATYKFFQNMGHECTCIDYCSPRFVENNRLKDEYRRFKGKKNLLIKLLFSLVMIPSIKKQEYIFEDFISKKVKFSDQKYFSNEELRQSMPPYDILCTGSDQVWNSNTNGFIERPFYLDFCEDNVKRIAFSASFGRSSIPDAEAEELKPMLKRYAGIGVREKSGVRLLNSLGIQAENTLDPTLACPPELWHALADESSVKIKEHYLLIYEFNGNGEIDKIAEKIAKEKRLRIVRISYWYHKQVKGETNIVLPDVATFLALIRNASYVVTNSFHAVVFSTIFHREFVAVVPLAFSVRIEDYLSLLKINNRLYNDSASFSACATPIEFDQVDQILVCERIKTQNYILSLLQ